MVNGHSSRTMSLDSYSKLYHTYRYHEPDDINKFEYCRYKGVLRTRHSTWSHAWRSCGNNPLVMSERVLYREYKLGNLKMEVLPRLLHRFRGAMTYILVAFKHGTTIQLHQLSVTIVNFIFCALESSSNHRFQQIFSERKWLRNILAVIPIWFLLELAFVRYSEVLIVE